MGPAVTWRLEYTRKARKQLEKLDRSRRDAIALWMHANVDGCENPRAHGRALVGNRSGQWRYRVGDYRVICTIEDDRLVVTAIEVGHRKGVY